MYFIKMYPGIFNELQSIFCYTLRFSLHREFCTSNSLLKIVPSNLKGKSKSSQDWLTRQLNDFYVKKSRYDNYRCRSAYKLIEIDDKYKILKPGFAVVDCGAAPGSWTQVIVEKLKLPKNSGSDAKNGIAIAVDLQNIMPIKGATIIRESDFTDPSVQEKIFQLLPNGKADVILSDMAPKASGMAELDKPEILRLVYSALGFSIKTLKKDGTFLCKTWDGSDVETFFKHLQSLFSSVKRIKPKASRSDSSELFLLARGFKGLAQNK